jgi:hypothetical protein
MNGVRYHSNAKVFAQHLHLHAHFQHWKKLRDRDPMAASRMGYMYLPESTPNPPSISGISPNIITLHRMLRVTLAPRIGDASTIHSYERNLIDAIKK